MFLRITRDKTYNSIISTLSLQRSRQKNAQCPLFEVFDANAKNIYKKKREKSVIEERNDIQFYMYKPQ